MAEPSDGALPSVSVIVPVLDGLDELRICVEAVLAQDYPAGQVQVVVADNGSAIWPAPLLPQDPRLQVIAAPGGGSYAARNAALEVATGEIIAFTDADCRPDAGWLRAAVAALEAEPAADLVGGAIELVFAAGRPVSGAEWYEYLHGFPQQEYLGRGFAVTANLVTRRAVIDRIGPFDASLASGGDAEWCRRIGASGGVLRYAAQARIEHPARATTAQLLTKSRRTTQGVATKALRRPGGRRSLVKALAGQFKAALLLTLTGWRAAEPDTAGARRAYLKVFWANTLAVSGELLSALRRAR